MNDKKIITQKEKNYIETLYLYCNLQDFGKNKDYGSSVEYWNVLAYMNDNMLPSAKCLGTANGRTWYQFANYRLGIMGHDEARIANQFNCLIQYEQHHMWTLDKDLTALDLPFDAPRSYYHIQRIDITKIAKTSTDYTHGYGYLSSFRGHPLRPNRKETTVYLGNRKNGIVFRLYPKTLELIETKNYKKMALLSAYFGDIENLTTFELELHRSYLKGSLGIETLDQLDMVYAANKNIVGKIRFFKDTDKNKKLVEQNHKSRIKAEILTDFEEYKRVEKKNYKPSMDYLIKRMVKNADIYLESMELPKTNELYLDIAMRFIRERVAHDGKDLVITFEDTLQSDENAQMRAKHTLLRDNQTNELEIEAMRAFGSIRESTAGKQIAILDEARSMSANKALDDEEVRTLFDD